VRVLLVFALAVALGAFAFLGASSFFDAWDGKVVARAARDGEAEWVQVQIDDDARRWWRAEVVEGLDLSKAPATHKDRFSLSYTVGGASHATTSVGAVSVAALVALLVVAVRNAAVAGAPWRFVPGDGPAPSLARQRPPARAGQPGFTRPAQSRNTRRRR
jgi:hypothetical protein